MAGDKVLDELICFLGEPIFQIPVRTFMDEHSLIFDPSIELGTEHEEVHRRYKKLVDTLLDSFLEDVENQYGKKMSHAEIISGIKKMNEIPDVKEVFQVIFEQVFAALDYEIFRKVMTKRNIMIQEQVLLMIIAATGQLPASMQFEVIKAGGDKQEEQVLKQAMSDSKREQESLIAQQKKADKDLKKTLEVSKREAELLQKDRHTLDEDLERLTLDSTVKAGSAKGVSTTVSSRKVPEPASYSRPSHSSSSSKPSEAPRRQISGAESASNWIESAKQEAGQSQYQSATHAAMAAKLSGLNADELRQRQEFLRKQRDLLIAKKKEARENQLQVAEQSHPKRPSSARAARSAMAGKESRQAPEDSAKLAMRKAIADRLKQEVINK